jgi:integrase
VSKSTASPSLAEIMPAYQKHLRNKRRSPRTIELRTYQVERFFKGTGLAPADVKLDDLRVWMDRPEWAANTSQVVKSSLSGFFGFAKEEKLLRKNPAKRLESPRVPAGKPKPASNEAVADALAKASPRVRLMIALGARAGLRAMEIAAVHSNDVELGPSGATLRKGSKTRMVPISDDLAEMLMSDIPGFLFPGRISGHISPAYVSRLVSQTLPPGVTCHKLRHRYATRAYNNSGHNLLAVKELLGHASVSTTQGYAGLDNDELRQAALSAE